ncbi:ATP-dependent helicase [Staphylococcus pseudintermedius]|uniref:ATP-dependent helicase n=1 Tax=Staphylococcus pseudintermedius TaxID=283734 RepID=UPI001BE0CDC6|nr:ATP-dependent helicase [Staphylococcus pseudintermedius]QWQ55175.1 ATP-dependent helicase [Staphylococcus pseudintermedius]HAR6090827.1 ATP-dependent helicase [Staphylococcus pseudintermedius]
MTYTISRKIEMSELKIQQDINECLDNFNSFCFDAAAGSGKTYALKKSIEHILKSEGENLKLKNQKILCITYTNIAKSEILNRIGKSITVLVSTIHEFLWSFISNQQELLILEHSKRIKEELDEIEKRIVGNKLSKIINLDEFQERVRNTEFLNVFYNHYSLKSRDFKEAIKGCDKYFEEYLNSAEDFKNIVKSINKKYKLQITLNEIEDNNTKKIIYNPTQNRDNLEKYMISHDTLLTYCENIITKQKLLKRLFSDRYPYVLIDEYQDTDVKVTNIIDSIREYSNSKKKFVVGFFGDTLQNIYGSGVGTLPKKENYTIIEKKYNRRSSKQIVELIEKIRNDNFGQTSIYTDYSNGSYKFYLSGDNFDLNDFLRENNLTKDTACLLMKNDNISKARAFDKLLSTLKMFPRFKGSNYNNVSNEFLQKNLQQMGWFLREVLAFVEFIQTSVNVNSTVNEVTQFVPDCKKSLTFGGLKNFLENITKVNFTDLTIKKCIDLVINISGEISGKSILNNIFSLDYDTENPFLYIKNRAYDYFYYSKDLEGDSEKDFSLIDKFFELNFSQFINWYKYIFDYSIKDGVNYYTLHGSKGLEFENVVVVLQDNFARKNDYFKHFFENYDSIGITDNQFNKVRNLLYVACSRAKVNLYVVYIPYSTKTQETPKIPEDISENIKSIFGDILIS